MNKKYVFIILGGVLAIFVIALSIIQFNKRKHTENELHEYTEEIKEEVSTVVQEEEYDEISNLGYKEDLIYNLSDFDISLTKESEYDPIKVDILCNIITQYSAIKNSSVLNYVYESSKVYVDKSVVCSLVDNDNNKIFIIVSYANEVKSGYVVTNKSQVKACEMIMQENPESYEEGLGEIILELENNNIPEDNQERTEYLRSINYNPEFVNIAAYVCDNLKLEGEIMISNRKNAMNIEGYNADIFTCNNRDFVVFYSDSDIKVVELSNCQTADYLR